VGKNRPKKQPTIREKLSKVGVKNLDEVELLTLILASGGKQGSVLQLAKQVLKVFPLAVLHRPSLAELIKISGIGIAKASQITAALELGRRNAQPSRERLVNPRSVLAHVSSIRGKRREHTICLYLNGRHELLHQETVAIGGLNYSLLEPRDVFSPALRLPASSVIVVHNHPSGSIRPSKEDLHVTKKLLQAGELLGVNLLDHLIVTKNQHASLREMGYFDKT